MSTKHSRTRRPPNVLREASLHLDYELDMMRSITTLLSGSDIEKGPVRNALLESFTIHARGLLHFFFPSGAQDGDILAQDYFPDAVTWKKARGAVPKELKEIEYRVGKEVAHLTYARLDVEPEAKGWPFPVICAALTELAEVFYGAVDRKLLQSDPPATSKSQD